jgi:DNA-binding MarR family transcriptional regulator
VIGRGLMRESTAALVAFCDARGLLPPPPQPRERKQPSLVGLLPRFCDYVSQRLMALTAGRGHDGLKLSYGYVLALIGPQGGRILQIAELQNVSKQAVSAIANELEERGYICREPDPANARQVLLRFTGFGRRLIEDSVRSIDDLEAEVRTTIGSGAFDALRTAMQQLYRDLQPEAAVFASAAPDIQQLAAELREKLPADARRQLAALLLR